MKKASILILSMIMISRITGQTFSIVNLSRDKKLNLYASYEHESTIVTQIPANTQNLATTWKTKEIDNQYWIQIIYNGEVGWVERKFVTRNEKPIKKMDYQRVEKLFINLTAALQQKDFNYLKKNIYSLRGLFLYSNEEQKFYYCSEVNLEKFWLKMSGKQAMRYPGLLNLFNQIRNFLEKDFELQFNQINPYPETLPFPLVNYDAIVLQNEEKMLQVGIEFWNNKPYLTYIALSRRGDKKIASKAGH